MDAVLDFSHGTEIELEIESPTAHRLALVFISGSALTLVSVTPL